MREQGFKSSRENDNVPLPYTNSHIQNKSKVLERCAFWKEKIISPFIWNLINHPYNFFLSHF